MQGISLAVAMGSATQIAMFVVWSAYRGIDLGSIYVFIEQILNINRLSLQIPFIIALVWIMGKPMDLDFHILETVALFATVLITTYILQVWSRQHYHVDDTL